MELAADRFNLVQDPQSSNQRFLWKTKFGVLVLVTFCCTLASLTVCAINFSGINKLQDHDKTLENLEDAFFEAIHHSDISPTTETVPTRVPIALACPSADRDKFDCHPEQNETQEVCKARGCCWAPSARTPSTYQNPAPVDVPQCFFPENYVGYSPEYVKERGDGFDILLTRSYPSGLPVDRKKVEVRVTHYNYHTARITIKCAEEERWIPPLPPIAEQSTEGDTSYDVVFGGGPKYNLSVFRKTIGPRQLLFSIPLATLIFSDQFLQASTSLPSGKVYGLGEMKGPLLHSVNWTRRILFNKDQPPRHNRALYGAHGLMVNLDNDNAASGVFIKNSNAMDVVLQPQPAATYRALGGIFDFFVFTGPTPQDVFAQYQKLIGRPVMVPYWSLGFHLCRYGYWSVERTIATYENNTNAKVPLEVQWNDIDYMSNWNMFTYDKNKYDHLPEFVKRVHDDGRQYMMIFDPAVSGSEPAGSYRPYDLGLEMDIFVKNISGAVVPYKVWNDQTSIYPDFTNPKTSIYWKTLIKEFHDQIAFDGMWIDMNEPSNQKNGTQLDNTCPQTSLDFPPVVIGGEKLSTYTACMSDRFFLSSHYNVHNLYPHFEARATYKALTQVRPNKRPFIISRATAPGQGIWSGHWTGDIDSTWEDMRQSIPDMINFAMYGMSMLGADICGFQYNTTDEMCARWHALGSFYPFSRNHNDKYQRDQDPASLGGDVLRAAINTLQKKYLFAPYLYTLLYRAHVFGETVVRAMMFNYPSDPATHALDEQFMWGDGLLIVPALHKGQTEVKPYLPAGVWYHYNENGVTYSMPQKESKSFPAPMDDINLFLRGGNILPGQATSGYSLSANRNNSFILFVALDEKRSARGQLFWDDGDSLDTLEKGEYTLVNFVASFNTILTQAEHKGYTTEPLVLSTIHVFGVDVAPTQLLLNGQPSENGSLHLEHDHATKRLIIKNINVTLSDSSNSIVFT